MWACAPAGGQTEIRPNKTRPGAALSRSLFSQLIPKGREAEYFGLYEISDKGTSWLAPVVFALAMQMTGSYRTSILPLAAMFLAGIFVLARVDIARGAREAQ